jgi:hypothetical protein
MIGEEGDFRFEALETFQKLADESKVMHHCVHRYWRDCINSGYRVYAVYGSDGERATLGLRSSSHDGDHLTYDQIRSVCNGDVSSAMKKAAKRFLHRINFSSHEPVMLPKAVGQ